MRVLALHKEQLHSHSPNVAGEYRRSSGSGSDPRRRRQDETQSLSSPESSYQESQRQQQHNRQQTAHLQASRLSSQRQIEQTQLPHARAASSGIAPPAGYAPSVPSDRIPRGNSPAYYQAQGVPRQFGSSEDRRLPSLPIQGHHVQQYPASAVTPQGQFTPGREWTSGSRPYEAVPEQQAYHHNQLAPSQLRSPMGPSAPDVPRARSPQDLPGTGDYPPAMPMAAPKARFTNEDDDLIKDLKENRRLTWKQIARFFPGRNPGTLQVRYCTKLKEKEDPMWTEGAVELLKQVRRDDDNDKWKRIAAKMGGTYSAAACQRKALEIDELEEGKRIEEEVEAAAAAEREMLLD